MNRGLERRRIFFCEEDMLCFLWLVRDCFERFGVECHKYALILNHYHLLLWDRLGLLSRAMKHLDGVYVQRFRKKYGGDGPLFRGRFKSRAIADKDGVLGVSGYIDFNGVKHELVTDPMDYPWTSYRAYVTGGSEPWLFQDKLLDLVGGQTEQHRRQFECFAWTHGGEDQAEWYVEEEALPEAPSPAPSEESPGAERAGRKQGPAVPRPTRTACVLGLDEVINAAADVLSVSSSQLKQRRARGLGRARSLCILTCLKLSNASVSQIADRFGITVSTARTLASRAGREPDAEGVVDRVRSRIDTARAVDLTG
jgi:REP element-mobilizing transposase RayT